MYIHIYVYIRPSREQPKRKRKTEVRHDARHAACQSLYASACKPQLGELTPVYYAEVVTVQVVIAKSEENT